MRYYTHVDLNTFREHLLHQQNEPVFYGVSPRKLAAGGAALLIALAYFAATLLLLPSSYPGLWFSLLFLAPLGALPWVAWGRFASGALVIFSIASLIAFPMSMQLIPATPAFIYPAMLLLFPALQLLLTFSLFLAFPKGRLAIESGCVAGLVAISVFPWVRGTAQEQVFLMFVVGVVVVQIRWVAHYILRALAVDHRKHAQLHRLNSEHEEFLRKSMEERGQLEYELFQARKMEALGQLAGGIAHDFNNVLAAISGYADLLTKRFGPENPAIMRYAGIILEACGRASGMIAQLLAYTRRGKYQRRTLDMHESIESVLRLLEHSLTGKVRVRTLFHASAPWFAGDPDQFQNTILNLAINARDAMPEGGDLLLRTSNETLSVGFGEQLGFRVEPGSYVKLEVIDTGTGMIAEVQQHLFEPFFTTKQGKGTGLGLAGVYGFVKSHGGYITVQSAPQQGSTFRIYLPAVAAPVVPEESGSDSLPAQRPTHSLCLVQEGGALIPSESPQPLRILVVDDEEPIRDLLREMLQRLGYHVDACADGDECLDWYSQQATKPDLVILDMIMPGLDGREVYLRLRALNPDLRALVISGFSRNEQVQELMDAGVLGLVPKPFQYKDLAQAVQKALLGG